MPGKDRLAAIAPLQVFLPARISSSASLPAKLPRARQERPRLRLLHTADVQAFCRAPLDEVGDHPFPAVPTAIVGAMRDLDPQSVGEALGYQGGVGGRGDRVALAGEEKGGDVGVDEVA